MASKSLLAAISDGVRPLGVKASLQSWLGVPISLQDGAFWSEWGGFGSWTGRRVTVDQALQNPAASACVRLISQTAATLPFGFYQRNSDGSRDPATSHKLYAILHNQPNADMTAVVFWQVVVASMLLWGNAYIEIIRSGNAVIALHFLHPARVAVRQLANGYEYRFRDDPGSAERVIQDANMMHIPAFSTDGKFGISPVIYGVNVLGGAIETDKASAETFSNSLRSPGIVTVDAVFKAGQRETIRAHVEKVAQDGGFMVLEKGTGFQKLGFDPVSAELLASRAWNVEEICRWFMVDPSMVGHGGKDSNWGTGLEQKMIWFLTFTLRQWCIRIEQAVSKDLLTPAERTKYFAEFVIEGLLRADSASRSAFYATAAQNGWMSRNEIRRRENLPRVEGGDALTVQSNLLPLGKLGESSQRTPP